MIAPLLVSIISNYYQFVLYIKVAPLRFLGLQQDTQNAPSSLVYDASHGPAKFRPRFFRHGRKFPRQSVLGEHIEGFAQHKSEAKRS